MPEQSLITIENNDCRMWDINNVIIDVTNAIHNGKDIIIILNSEGPCAYSLGLYKLLDTICEKTEYPKDRISIITNNLIEKHNKYKIKIQAPFKHIADLQQEYKNVVQTKSIKKYFGNFIGHGSRVRLELASYLWKFYKEKTLQTYHCVPTEDYHREFIGLEDLWFYHYGTESVNRAVEFLQNTPVKFDTVESYPILDRKMYGIQNAYNDIFVDIVSSTYFTGNTFYMDEKVWRPILSKTPFMIHGPKNFIKNFKILGFETFDQWWDEGYSEDDPDYQVNLIKENIDEIAKLTIKDLKQMYKQMKPVLDHNYNHFMSLTKESFLSREYL